MADGTNKSTPDPNPPAAGGTPGVLPAAPAPGGARAGQGLDYAPPPAPSRLQRGLSATRRWTRDTFSREQLASALKQLAWVAPLTLLIWIYADREQQDVFRDVRFPIAVSTNNPNVYVRLVQPSDGYVAADLTGSRAQLEDIRDGVGRQSPVRFEIRGDDLKEGERQVPVSAIVNRDPRFQGVTLTKSEPSQILVMVDRVVEESIPVQVREEDKALFDQVVFTPERVRVRMPRAALEAAKAAPGGLAAYADLAALPERTPGRKVEAAAVRVTIPHVDPDVSSVEPATVSAALVVRDRAKPFTLDTLTVLESVPTRLRDSVKVDIDPVNLFDVVISGPPEVIDRIAASGGAGVMAHVSIGADDLDKGPLAKKPWFSLPDGARVVKYRGMDEGVRVTVTSTNTP